jgi:hypothetical protein
MVATCSVDGADLGEWQVRNGLAFDWPQYSKRKYDAAQRDAEHAGRGIWAGSYVEPWLYRACIRAGGNAVGCSDDTNAHPLSLIRREPPPRDRCSFRIIDWRTVSSLEASPNHRQIDLSFGGANEEHF